MRTLAFEASTAPIVAVTEDHCVPAPGWARTLKTAFDEGGPELVAVGGTVVNGVTDRGLDWATYLCEYSFFSPPVVEGDSAVLPGMNVAYRRSALEGVPRDLLTSGFWETTVIRSCSRKAGAFCRSTSSSCCTRSGFPGDSSRRSGSSTLAIMPGGGSATQGCPSAPPLRSPRSLCRRCCSSAPCRPPGARVSAAKCGVPRRIFSHSMHLGRRRERGGAARTGQRSRDDRVTGFVCPECRARVEQGEGGYYCSSLHAAFTRSCSEFPISAFAATSICRWRRSARKRRGCMSSQQSTAFASSSAYYYSITDDVPERLAAASPGIS